jgi:LEA14-like dessication related protein
MCSNLAVRHALAPCSGSAPLSRRLAPVLLVLALAGCSSMTSTEPPRVTLSDLQVSEVTVFETTLVAKLRVTNPNPEPLTLDGGSFELILDGKKVGSGAVQSTFTIERLDSTVVDAVFHVNNASLILRLKNVLDQQVVSYGIRGSFFTAGTFGPSKLKVDKSGVLDLSKAASLQPEVGDAGD